MKALEGKNAYITGASRGIGKGIALEFARQGANVAITDLRESDLTPELIAEFEAFGVKCIAIACDASNFAATQEAMEKTVAAFGTIDILVNNAGITMDTLLLRMTEEQFDTVLRVNLKSAFYSTKAVLKPMLKQPGPRIKAWQPALARRCGMARRFPVRLKRLEMQRAVIFWPWCFA